MDVIPRIGSLSGVTADSRIVTYDFFANKNWQQQPNPKVHRAGIKR
jgi:hypothetical protein